LLALNDLAKKIGGKHKISALNGTNNDESLDHVANGISWVIITHQLDFIKSRSLSLSND